MKIIKSSFKIETEVNGNELLKQIEKIGRICYKSEDKITNSSAEKFVKGLISRGHEAMIEHNAITVRFICDRGVSHELVRHRLASFAQESTRYCNYSQDKFDNEITVIEPIGLTSNQYTTWKSCCESAEMYYFILLDNNSTPEMARSVLPNSLKTEIVMTMNLREWRHFFKLRIDKASHPQMRELIIPLLEEFKKLITIVFDDIELNI